MGCAALGQEAYLISFNPHSSVYTSRPGLHEAWTSQTVSVSTWARAHGVLRIHHYWFHTLPPTTIIQPAFQMRKSRLEKPMDVFTKVLISMEIGRQSRLLGSRVCTTTFTNQLLWILGDGNGDRASASLVDSGIGRIRLFLQMETQRLRSVHP